MSDNPDGKVLRPMYVSTSDGLMNRIGAKTDTYEEIAELFAHSRRRNTEMPSQRRK
jgi:hypothetical protein